MSLPIEEQLQIFKTLLSKSRYDFSEAEKDIVDAFIETIKRTEHHTISPDKTNITKTHTDKIENPRKKTHVDAVIKLVNTLPEKISAPNGLYYFPNFITQSESEKILSELSANKKWVGVTSCKNSRRVIHYGYLYSYAGGPLNPTDPIPSFYDDIISNTVDTCPIDNIPKFDQLIINEYMCGQGITPHIDDTKKFGPIIACVTLGSGIEIEFTRSQHETFKIYVEPNSLYIMSGDARYLWKHGIIQRKTDRVDGKRHCRGTRISLTFRTAC